MLTNKFVRLIVLNSVGLFICSCADKSIDLIGNSLNNLQKVELKLPSEVKNLSKLRTDNLLVSKDIASQLNLYPNNQVVIGDYEHHELANVQPRLYTQILLPPDGFPFSGYNSGVSIHSVYLLLPYASQDLETTFNGDLNATFKFNVHELQTALKSTDVPYFSDKSLLSSGNNLALDSMTLVDPSKEEELPDYENGVQAGTKKVSGYIIIKLDKEFFATKFLAATDSDVKTQQDFSNYFKGLDISVSKQSTKGGLIKLSMGKEKRPLAKLLVYYSREKSGKNYYDVAEFFLPQSSAQSQGVFYSFFNCSAAKLAKAFTDDLTLSYLGLNHLQLDLRQVQDYFTSLRGKILINAATIKARVEDSVGINNATNSLQRLSINKGYNTQGETLWPFDTQAGFPYAHNDTGGVFNKEGSYYELNVVTFMQQLLLTEQNNDNFFISWHIAQQAIYPITFKTPFTLTIYYSHVEE